jgi:hypothetical protein
MTLNCYETDRGGERVGGSDLCHFVRKRRRCSWITLKFFGKRAAKGTRGNRSVTNELLNQDSLTVP